MPPSQSDRNVLFGVLALQMEFITQAGLIAALQAWTLQKTKPLGELLVELGHMSAEDREALEPMVDRHVARHGGSAEHSLGALSSVSDIVAELRDVSDGDVLQSLQRMSQSELRQAGCLSGAVPPSGPVQNTQDEPPPTEPTVLQTEKILAPLSLAKRAAASVSAVSPDCETVMTMSPAPIVVSR